ncbi:MAG: HAD family hydrolase [Terracidiphilus sp.]
MIVVARVRQLRGYGSLDSTAAASAQSTAKQRVVPGARGDSVMQWRAHTIIFDLDGVLIDSGKGIANAVNFTLRTLGRPVLPSEQIIGYIGPGVEGVWRKCLGADADQLLDIAIPIYKARYRENGVAETTCYPGVPETLSRLKSQGKIMAVATNKPGEFTQLTLQKLDIARYFDIVVDAESVHHRKPDPEAIELILAKLKVPPETTIVVGDAATDIQAAKAAKTISCGVTYGYGSPHEIVAARPDFIIDRMEDLLSSIV